MAVRRNADIVESPRRAVTTVNPRQVNSTGVAVLGGSRGPRGPKGDQGIQGNQGAQGPGVASGGNTGQVLAKLSGADYHTGWVSPSGGSGSTFSGWATNADFSTVRSSDPDRSPPAEMNWFFGGHWKVHHRIYSSSQLAYNVVPGFNGARATMGVMRSVLGSGANGPANTDGAAWFFVEKQNYLTSTVEGEIDAIYLSVVSNRKGDAGGIMVDIVKVGGFEGGIACTEMVGRKVDTAGVEYQSAHALLSFGEGPGGVSNDSFYGCYVETSAGANLYSAYHAEDRFYSATSTWANILTYSRGRVANGGGVVMRIDGNGKVLGAAAGVGGPSFAFQAEANTGMYRIGAGTIGWACSGVGKLQLATTHLAPFTDNSITLGASAARWSAIWSATTTISTSDEKTKIDLGPIDLGRDFILDPTIKLMRARFKVGGMEEYTELEEETVEEPVLDADGNPKVRLIPVRDRNGEPLTEQVDTGGRDKKGQAIYRTKTRMSAEPILVKKKRQVEVTKARPVEGKRIHYTFGARSVAKALKKHKVEDFSGLVMEDPSNPNSLHGLREAGPFVAILWNGFREQDAHYSKIIGELTKQNIALMKRVEKLEKRAS